VKEEIFEGMQTKKHFKEKKKKLRILE